MAWISLVRSNRETYVYLTEYIGDQTFTTKKELHVYRFGKINDALQDMKNWQQGREFFPLELYDKGYNYPDLCEWIQFLEGKISEPVKYFYEK